MKPHHPTALSDLISEAGRIYAGRDVSRHSPVEFETPDFVEAVQSVFKLDEDATARVAGKTAHGLAMWAGAFLANTPGVTFARGVWRYVPAAEPARPSWVHQWRRIAGRNEAQGVLPDGWGERPSQPEAVSWSLAEWSVF